MQFKRISVLLFSLMVTFQGCIGSGNSDLLKAAAKGDTHAVLVQLENGANVNEKNTEGKTALYYATMKGSANTVKILLVKGADINAADKDGLTPLMLATGKGYSDIVRILLDHGAVAGTSEIDGVGALSMAQNAEHHEIAELLIEAGVEDAIPGVLATRLDDTTKYEAAAPSAGDTIMAIFQREGLDGLHLNLPYDRSKSGNQILFETKCSRCHPVSRPLSKRKTLEEWDKTTLRMRSFIPIWISEEERKSIVYYLARIRGQGEPKEISADQALFENKCSRCHSIDRPLFALEPLDKWPEIIDKMRKKAPQWITEEEAEIITDYLVENIEARRAGVHDKKDVSDDQALFDVKCSRCHVLDRPIKVTDFSSNDWARTVIRMQMKVTDWISIEEAKTIIDYLVKTHPQTRNDN